ncbi:MAG: hydroxymethylbilane synthase [Candidatus Portiera sp.]|nr:hydroxymethylbilane synthase [Portiera sp.]
MPKIKNTIKNKMKTTTNYNLSKPLRIVTRSSSLAVCQSSMIGKQLTNIHKGLTYELVKVGNLPVNHKDSFVKLCEECLTKGDADLAVHSAKDLPIQSRKGLEIAAYCRRENPLDVIIFAPEYEMAKRSATPIKIGTASPRRRVQLMNQSQEYLVEGLRGNITTRIEALKPETATQENPTKSKLDAIVLAAAGLIRLQRTSIISHYLTPAEMVPAAGQGALALQCLTSREDIKDLTKQLKHQPTELCLTAERHCCHLLGADCDSAVGVYAFLSEDVMHIYSMVGDISTNKIIQVRQQLPVLGGDFDEMQEKAKLAGELVANELIEQGANNFIYKRTPPTK